MLSLALLFIGLLCAEAWAADRYWVGGTGNWSDATNHWSDTSGGTPNASFLPTSSDNCNFDNSSSTANAAYSVTVNAAATCLNFTMDGPGGGNKVTWAGASTLAITGSLNLSGGTSGITRNYSGAITLNSTSGTQTITTNSVSLGSTITFDGVGGSWQLADAFTTTAAITLTNGTFDTTGKTVSATAILSNNSNTRTLTLGASFITLSLNGNAIDFTTVTGFTFNSNTSTITLTGGGSLIGGGKTFNDVTYTGFTGNPTISGANTFNNFTVTGTASKLIVINFAANQTIAGTLNVTGNSEANRILVRSSVTGTTRTLTAAAESLSYADFMDITGAGAASPFTGTSLGDALGNSGITFTQNSGTSNGAGGVYRYWVAAGSASWSATTSWSESSGGASGASVPLAHDTVIFDANSGAGARTVTCDMSRLGADVDMSGISAGAVALALVSGSVPNYIFGDIKLASNITPSGTGSTLTLGARSSKVITNAGRTFTPQITIDAPGGTYTLQDAFADSRTTNSLVLYQGTFDANDYNVTLGGAFYSTYTTARTLNMGSGTWTFTGTGAPIWNAATVTNFTLNAETSTIKFTNTSNTAISFSGGGKTYNNIWFNRGGSNANITIIGSNIFNDFKDDGTTAHSILFTAGIITTVTTWNVSGTGVGSRITINSTSTATHTLVKRGGGVVSADYLNIQHSIATPGTTTWYAGASSLNNQGVATAGSGWIFTAPPSVCTATTTGNWNTTGNWSGCTGAGGIPAAADNVIIGAGVTITLDVNTPTVNSLGIDGTLDTSGSSYQVNTKNLSVNSGGTLTANGSTITLSGTDGILFTLHSSGTFTAGTSTVVMNPDAPTTLTDGTFTFNNLTLSPTLSAARTNTFGIGAITANGNFTSDPNGGGSARLLTVNLGVGGLSVAGTFTVGGNNSGTTTLSTTASNPPMTFAAVTINAGSTLTPNGSNVMITGTSGTLITNTGTWTAQATPGTTTLSGNSSATVSSAGLTFYNLTSSGTGTKTLGGNTTVGNYFSITNGTFDISSRTLTLSGANGAPFMVPSGGGTFSGGTGTVTYSGNNALGDTTIESSVTYYSLTLNNAAERYVPNGAINGNAAGTLTITNGEIDVTTNNYAINFGKMSIANAATAILTARNSTITLNGTLAVFTANVLSTITSSTATIKVTDTSNTAVTFAGAGNIYNNLWFDRGASTGNITISGSSTFNEFKDTGTVAHSILFTAGTTTSVYNWYVSGTAGNLITINSTSTATHTLSKLGGGVVSADYLNIQHSIATPSSTWYAGPEPAHSTNNQATATAGSGWIFDAAPSVCTAVVTGNWNTPGNWVACTGGGVPAADDNVVIAAGVTITLDVNTPAIGSLGIDGTLDTSGSSYQIDSKNLSINDGGTLTANGSTIILSKNSGVLFAKSSSGTFDAGTSTVTMSSDAAVTLISGNVTFNNLTLSPALTASRTYTFGSGTVTVSGNFTSDPNGGAVARVLTVNLGDTATITGTCTLGGNNSGTTLLDTTASNYALGFASLTINSGSTLTPRGSNVTITGTSGTLITNTGTWTAQTGGTTSLLGDGDVAVSSAALTFYGLTINSTGTKTFGVNTTMSGNLTLTKGGLDLGSGRTYSCYAFSSSVTNVRSLTMNDATLNITGTNTTIWNTATVTNFTLDAGTSTINVTNTNNQNVIFAGGGKTYNNVRFNRGASTGAITLSGNNTFNEFRDSGTAAHSLLFTNGTNNTFTSFVVNGTAGSLITINSTNTATHTLTKSGGGTVFCDYLNILHSVASPASTWYAGPGSVNNQGVATAGSGWTFAINPFFISAD